MTETDEIRRKRLSFRSRHCGSRELDFMLGRFADRHMHSLTPRQLDRYEALLSRPDPDIYRWISGRESPPASHDNDILDLIKNPETDIE